MTNLTNKYQRGKVYKLVNFLNDEIYVGSTIQPLRKRKYQHKCDFSRKKNYLYEKLKECGCSKNDIDLILIEEYPCNSKFELHKRERYWIEKLKGSLNNNIPTRTRKEYKNNNKENIRNQNIKWYKKNIEIIKIKGKIYRENNREKEKLRHKIYRENNKEKEKLRHKIYEKNNKEKIKQKSKQKVPCICGIVTRKDGKWKHRRSKNHHNRLIRLIHQ